MLTPCVTPLWWGTLLTHHILFPLWVLLTVVVNSADTPHSVFTLVVAHCGCELCWHTTFCSHYGCCSLWLWTLLTHHILFSLWLLFSVVVNSADTQHSVLTLVVVHCGCELCWHTTFCFHSGCCSLWLWTLLTHHILLSLWLLLTVVVNSADKPHYVLTLVVVHCGCELCWHTTFCFHSGCCSLWLGTLRTHPILFSLRLLLTVTLNSADTPHSVLTMVVAHCGCKCIISKQFSLSRFGMVLSRILSGRWQRIIFLFCRGPINNDVLLSAHHFVPMFSISDPRNIHVVTQYV